MPAWLRAAKEDRRAIVEFIRQDNPKATVDLSDLLIRKAEMLDTFSEIGRRGRITGTREIVAHLPYVIVYDVRVCVTRVLRVRHTVRQWL